MTGTRRAPWSLPRSTRSSLTTVHSTISFSHNLDDITLNHQNRWFCGSLPPEAKLQFFKPAGCVKSSELAGGNRLSQRRGDLISRQKTRPSQPCILPRSSHEAIGGLGRRQAYTELSRVSGGMMQ